MAVVELRLTPLPSHVRTARLVVVAAARRAGMDAELVDDLRLAIGEACTRAVGLHAEHAPDAEVVITVTDGPTGLSVTVTDVGPPASGAPVDLLAGLVEAAQGADPGEVPPAAGTDAADIGDVAAPDVSLAVLAGLVDDLEVAPGPSGTVVTMRWPLPVRLAGLPGTAAAPV
ncbi:MAG: ATP-binding protein [Actinomycetota bacterium]|nr:ATP-binding protein [Actinomycetota bacterium]